MNAKEVQFTKWPLMWNGELSVLGNAVGKVFMQTGFAQEFLRA